MTGARTRIDGSLAVDAVLAVLVGVVTAIGSRYAAMGQVPPRRPLDTVAYGLMAVAAGALAARRVRPLAGLGVAVGATTAYLALRYPYGPIFFAPAIALYTVGAALPVRRSLAASAAAVGAILVAQLAGIPVAGLPAMVVHLVSWQAWLLGLPFAAGLAVRAQRQSRARDHEEMVRRLAYEERLRVARDVHDVVGHGLAVINMQAGVALHVLERRPEQAAHALQAIKQTSKDALEDLRATLAVFRQREPAARRPEPGLEQLEGLVAAMREGGLEVDVVMAGQPPKLPAAVDVAAYRIVQESLTNVLRHAGSTSATVRVDHAPGQVVIEVTDRGRGRGAAEPRHGGHGIAGMRERAAAIGGSLEAGPRQGAGFRVHARLPLTAP
jgi:signal transduction histidine kinase